MLRPMLQVNGRPAPVSLLEKVVLQITAVNRENTRTTQEVRDLKLADDRETTYVFQVPDNLKSLQFTLRAEVPNLSESKKDELADATDFDLNGIDETDRVEDMHLLHAGRQVLAGGPRQDRRGQGRPRRERGTEAPGLHGDRPGAAAAPTPPAASRLGDLTGIDWVKVSGAGPRLHVVAVARPLRYPAAIHGKAGEAIYVPYMGKAGKIGPEAFSLLEWRGNSFLADHLAAMKLEGGLLVIQDLPR